MTKNQIDYANYKENQRHNLVTEQIASGELDVHRGQLAFNYANLAEVSRHNRTDEGIRQNTLNETVRHNIVNEGISQEQNRISEEHYLRADNENIRHNKRVEELEAGKVATMETQASAALQQAQAALMNASTNRRAQEESIRHNVQLENLEHTRNLVNTWSYAETVRHNKVVEDQGQQSINQKWVNALTDAVSLAVR